MQTEPKVKILADSISPRGVRLTTFELEYWRAIHSEIMTHRVFSRNARSSRATPIATNINNVKTNCYGPKHWGINQKGMQAITEMNSFNEVSNLQQIWQAMATGVAQFAEQLQNMQLHKQVVNRILEPFSSIQVVLSATDFKNFFYLRESPNAQPEMQDLAKAMHRAMSESEPKELSYNEWHLPYVSTEEKETLSVETQKKISVARCARVSYKAFDGSSSVEEDIALADKLLKNKHMSAFEHIATPATEDGYFPSNFRGWNQYRKFFPDEAIHE